MLKKLLLKAVSATAGAHHTAALQVHTLATEEHRSFEECCGAIANFALREYQSCSSSNSDLIRKRNSLQVLAFIAAGASINHSFLGCCVMHVSVTDYDTNLDITIANYHDAMRDRLEDFGLSQSLTRGKLWPGYLNADVEAIQVLLCTIPDRDLMTGVAWYNNLLDSMELSDPPLTMSEIRGGNTYDPYALNDYLDSEARRIDAINRSRDGYEKGVFKRHDPRNIKSFDLPIPTDEDARQRQGQLMFQLRDAAPGADHQIIGGMIEYFEHLNRQDGNPDLYFPYRIDEMWAIGFGTVLHNPPSKGNQHIVAAFSSGITSRQAITLAVPKALQQSDSQISAVIKSFLIPIANVGLKYSSCKGCYWFDIFGNERKGNLEVIHMYESLHGYGPPWNIVALIEAEDGTLHSIPCTPALKVTLPMNWHEQTGGFQILSNQAIQKTTEDTVWEAIRECFRVES